MEVVCQQPGVILDERDFAQERAVEVGRERLWEAASIGDEEEIRLVAAYLDVDVNAVDTFLFNFTALHFAAVHGRAGVVPLLASLGADLDKQDVVGNTALHYAADKGFPKVVLELLRYGATAWTENKLGRVPLAWALDSILWYKAHPYSADTPEPMTPGRWECVVLLREALGWGHPYDLLATLGYEPTASSSIGRKRAASAGSIRNLVTGSGPVTRKRLRRSGRADSDESQLDSEDSGDFVGSEPGEPASGPGGQFEGMSESHPASQ